MMRGLLAISSDTHLISFPWLRLKNLQNVIYEEQPQSWLNPMLYIFQVVSCHQLLLARIGTSYLCILICEFDTLLVDEGSLNHFPKHLIGLSTIDRTSFLWICILRRLSTRPFLNSRFLYLFALIFMRVQEMLPSHADRINLTCVWVVVDTVKSSIKLLIGGWYIPDSILSPLVYLSAALVTIHIPITNRIGEIVHYMTIPFSTP